MRVRLYPLFVLFVSMSTALHTTVMPVALQLPSGNSIALGCGRVSVSIVKAIPTAPGMINLADMVWVLLC